MQGEVSETVMLIEKSLLPPKGDYKIYEGLSCEEAPNKLNYKIKRIFNNKFVLSLPF